MDHEPEKRLAPTRFAALKGIVIWGRGETELEAMQNAEEALRKNGHPVEDLRTIALPGERDGAAS